MDENNEIIEEFHGTEIQAAVLHVLDGKHHMTVFSERTLDLEDPQTEKYVKRYVSRCRNDMRSREGTFREDSAFAREMDRYFHHECDLPSFSAAALSGLAEYFEQEEARSFDVLFADYRSDDVPYILVVLLEEQETMTWMTDTDHGSVRNTISFGHAALPAVSRPVASFAAVNMLNKEIRFTDEGKWKNGISVIADRLLSVNAGVSRKEIVETVKNIAVEVAEEFNENPTVVLGKVKNYITETVSEGMPLRTETLAEEMFEDIPDMAEAFRQKVRAQTLPEEIELPKQAVTAAMKKQRLKTDTGIEISVPAEYCQDTNYIEFHREEDGTIRIEIKGIGSITNKI
ncbi:MAG: nucleoid-associated protein [Solobacterium sp.]|nr:nucleoid-associated protein [Solobacterium sp.]